MVTPNRVKSMPSAAYIKVKLEVMDDTYHCNLLLAPMSIWYGNTSLDNKPRISLRLRMVSSIGTSVISYEQYHQLCYSEFTCCGTWNIQLSRCTIFSITGDLFQTHSHHCFHHNVEMYRWHETKLREPTCVLKLIPNPLPCLGENLISWPVLPISWDWPHNLAVSPLNNTSTDNHSIFPSPLIF